MPLIETLTPELPPSPTVAQQAAFDAVGMITKTINVDLTTEVSGGLPNKNLALMPALTVKANLTAAPAPPIDATSAQLAAAGFGGGGSGVMLQDHGADQGVITILDIEGVDVTASVAGVTGTIKLFPSTARVLTVNSATGAQVVDMSFYDAVIFNLVGNVSVTFSNGGEFQVCRLRFVQDATGGRTVTFGAGVSYGTDLTSFTASVTALKTDNVGVVRNLIAGRYEVVSYARGY